MQQRVWHTSLPIFDAYTARHSAHPVLQYVNDKHVLMHNIVANIGNQCFWEQ